MSQLLIQQYLNQLSTLRKVSGTQRESVVREAFKDLLKGWAKSHDLVFIPEFKIESRTKERRFVDGALLYELRVPFGYWEAKDADDDLDDMVESKFKAGYPQDNIIFENGVDAILIQDREEVMRCAVDDVKSLEKLLNLFFSHERAEIAEFRKAVTQFKADLPAVLQSLRDMIDSAHTESASFRKASAAFLKHAQETINKSLVDADVREMLIQHILTEEIFSAIFPQTPFHRDNNVARELYKLEGTFFTGQTKFKTLRGLAPYYAAIRSAAAQVAGHHEKQAFLKVIYENFYKVYNPKAADRLGVVYTPNEIVRFMIESADWLCEKHFGRNLIDKEVEILDPATGTGTFICELLEHFRGQPAKLKHKYLPELHANEVAILPYYVANLNIEATYAAITGEYEEYPNLCFVDTLDNTAGLRKHAGHIDDLFGGVSDINIKRVREQNARKISVVIGNPPYNANQLNENQNNKNREYPEIDKRIKDTYIAASNAQKTKLYDMYARFFRWASDRLDANGILAFVTNRSYLAMRAFDGFRKLAEEEFNEIYVVDLGGDVRANPKLSGTKHNVFGIQTGVAISFLVRRQKAKGCRIHYARRPEFEIASEKLDFLQSTTLKSLQFADVSPDENHEWLDLESNDFETLTPLVSYKTKTRSIFSNLAIGVSTNRDDWVFDRKYEDLLEKARFTVDEFNSEAASLPKSVKEYKDIERRDLRPTVKWSEALKRRLLSRNELELDAELVRPLLYRPYSPRIYYAEKSLSDRLTSNHYLQFGRELRDENLVIAFSGVGASKPFQVLATTRLTGLDCLEKTQTVALFIYDPKLGETDGISSWALSSFQRRYPKGSARGKPSIRSKDIANYVYGVLHDPVYREKYALNLKREFPRIPFYKDFWEWADWGKELMDLHIGYEAVEPWKLKRKDVEDEKAKKAGLSPKAMLKADKEGGRIVLDSETTLEGVPPEAWQYRLGNRSALEWILDQYKESKPKDPTIREKFDTYRFADYKENVIDLLARVTRVSVETQRIVEAMKKATR